MSDTEKPEGKNISHVVRHVDFKKDVSHDLEAAENFEKDLVTAIDKAYESGANGFEVIALLQIYIARETTDVLDTSDI